MISDSKYCLIIRNDSLLNITERENEKILKVVRIVFFLFYNVRTKKKIICFGIKFLD